MQSPEASKEGSGTSAACSAPRRRAPSLARGRQLEGFGIKNYSEIETVLAELKCYISAERLQMNGQDSILFICMLQLGQVEGAGATRGFRRHWFS